MMKWTIFIFILSIIFQKEIISVTCLNECLKDLKEIPPRRFFQLESGVQNITLETSGRLGQRLITEAFRIFLTEVLGYESVNVILIEDHFNASGPLDRLLGDRYHPESVPTSTINLGLWISPDLDLTEWTTRGDVESCGHLGFPSRLGWFTVRNSSLLRSNPKLPIDYWRTYAENTQITKLFSLKEDDMKYAEELSKDPKNGQYYCRHDYCQKGSFEPENCRGNDACAVMLHSYPDISPDLPSEIISLGLFIRVIYVGPHLETLLRHLIKKYDDANEQRSVLFFAWKPSLISLDFDLLQISLPSCNENSFCNYETRKLQKVVWRKLKEGGKLAFEATHRLSLTLQDLNGFLELYQNRSLAGGTFTSVSCEWLQQNGQIWKSWRSVEGAEKSIYIGGIFPMSGGYTDQCIAVAANMAAVAVNQNKSVLKDYNLILHSQDGQCRADKVMKSFIDYIRLPHFPSMAGILGPACSDTVEPIAGVATYFETVVISYSAEGSTFSDKEKYPYFFRTIGGNRQYLQVYLKLFQTLGWKRIASLTEEGQKYAEYVSHLQDLLQQNNIGFVANRKFPKEALNMSQYLEDLKSKKAKIIIGDFYDHAARAVMCEAYRQRMTAEEGYVWFLPMWFVDDWYDTDRYNSISNKDKIPCNTSEMTQAINGHLALQHAYFANDDEIIQEGITVKEWRSKYELNCKVRNSPVSDYAGYAYDAVWVYAYALNELLSQNQSHIANLHSQNTTKKFVEIIKQTDFQGLSGHIKFVDGPSRLSTILVFQWLNRKSRIVGTFKPYPFHNISIQHSENFSELHLNESAIVWLNPEKTVPSDGSEPPPTCVLHTLASALDVSCEAAIVVANVTGFGFLGIVLLVCFIVIKRRYEKRVQLTEDYMKALGIDISTVTNATALDKWEIQQDRLVINRKIGEGAFGFVYGGECYIDEKAAWVAVAVKTLKSGSTLEQKLEFLSEAEVMKRFDHKNILKLIGVQTKGEPVVMVMEYMLYGDLKTFLLSRRDLVDEKTSEESDDISSKRLTSMALDISRAVSYLAELKYVHRDIACRNCLLTSNRVVKLGDFGMTRSMYENDYYRFNRKGLLPVRWMPPESLALGRFTPASDVWSLGVVIYEIITFGSYPFQGYSNNQVLEYVKQGRTLNVPRGVKPQLETLLVSTWAFEPSKRPQASEIVEFLANNPRIISPCLELPLAAAQVEGLDVLEVQLPKHKKAKKRIIDTNSPPPELIPLTGGNQSNALLNL